MIYCPQCGTPNKPNSKFCRNCGSLLAPPTEVRCPICGNQNPIDSKTCQHCGARLSGEAREGPSPESPDTLAPFTPPEIPPSDQFGEFSGEARPSNPSPVSARPLPEWVRRVKRMDDLPVPLNGTDQETPQVESTTDNSDIVPSSEPTSDSDLPGWLNSLPATDDEKKSGDIHSRDEITSLNNSPLPLSVTPPASPPADFQLTGDSYDYGDIGGHVTDAMKAALSTEASHLASVEDEVALARRLLGLEVDQATQPSAVEPIPQVPPPAPALSSTASLEPPSAEQLTELAHAPTAEAAVTAEPIVLVAEPPTAEPMASVTEPPAAELMASVAEPPAADPMASVAEPLASEPPAPPPSITEPSIPRPPTRYEGELETGEMPEWIHEISPPALAVEAAILTDEEQAELPDWLQDRAGVTMGAGAKAASSQVPALDQADINELPDWLKEPVSPEGVASDTALDQAAVQSPTAAELPVPELPAGSGIELPTWLREVGRPLSVPTAEAHVETTGPLAGITGVLPLALALTEPHTLTQLAPVRSTGGRIMEGLLAAPLGLDARLQGTATATRSLLANRLIYLVIFLTALVALLLPFDWAGLGLSVTNPPSAAFYDEIHVAAPGSTVLIAFEYTPGQAVELDPAARVIASELARRGVNVIAISYSPMGAAIAEKVLNETRSAAPPLTFVNVGYIPGAEAGLRALASGWLASTRTTVNGATWGASPLAAQVRSMDDLALTIVLAGDDSQLRAWMEQVRPRVTSPFVAATTAAIDLQARNFVDAGQLRASLRGLTGAAELELLSNNAGRATKTVDALSLVSLALAVVIVAAGVAGIVSKGNK